jgi:hypothetical protein
MFELWAFHSDLFFMKLESEGELRHQLILSGQICVNKGKKHRVSYCLELVFDIRCQKPFILT